MDPLVILPNFKTANSIMATEIYDFSLWDTKYAWEMICKMYSIVCMYDDDLNAFDE